MDSGVVLHWKGLQDNKKPYSRYPSVISIFALHLLEAYY